MPSIPHICVCVCTFQRPEYLRRLLDKLERQRSNELFDYSIVIVDNDFRESARTVVEAFSRQSKISCRYYVETNQNISVARNKAIENARGDLFAFIDDDEFPDEKWLLNLSNALSHYHADGVLGPVLPSFDEQPPKWVLKGRFFDRPSHPTGHVLAWQQTRTGNALVKKTLFEENRAWFDPTFGSGGEDRDLFRRRIEEGFIFVWCNEAPVFETIPSIRWKRTVLLKRALLRGKMARHSKQPKLTSILLSSVAIALYAVLLPFFFFLGHHIFMKYLIKECDHLGKILSFAGIELVEEKYVRG
jgi:succinoglycan biosynthesis protein ExoM